MLDDLQPALRYAIMTILATVYETGTVDEVDMADVMRLFGAHPEPGLATRFSFTDEGWIDAYLDFRENVGAELFAYEYDPDEANPEDIEDGDLDPDRKLH